MSGQPSQETFEGPHVRARVGRFGQYEADFERQELRKNGVKIGLQEQPFQVLRILLEHGGAIVTREELRTRLWPADVFVGFDASLNTAMNKLRRALREDPDRPVFIETLPRHGYRFLAPVSWTGLTDSGEGPSQLARIKGPVRVFFQETLRSWFRNLLGWRGTLALVSVCLGIIIGTSVLVRVMVSRTAGSKREKIVVLVLPFDNLNADPSQNYLSDGFTEEMITQLEGRYARCLRVLAKSSAVQLKATHMPLDQMARQLGIDYVLEGSVRRSDERIRVSVKLVHASDQMSIWANAYDEETKSDLIAIQSDVSSRIAESLALEIVPYAHYSPPSRIFWQTARTGGLQATNRSVVFGYQRLRASHG